MRSASSLPLMTARSSDCNNGVSSDAVEDWYKRAYKVVDPVTVHDEGISPTAVLIGRGGIDVPAGAGSAGVSPVICPSPSHPLTSTSRERENTNASRERRERIIDGAMCEARSSEQEDIEQYRKQATWHCGHHRLLAASIGAMHGAADFFRKL